MSCGKVDKIVSKSGVAALVGLGGFGRGGCAHFDFGVF